MTRRGGVAALGLLGALLIGGVSQSFLWRWGLGGVSNVTDSQFMWVLLIFGVAWGWAEGRVGRGAWADPGVVRAAGGSFSAHHGRHRPRESTRAHELRRRGVPTAPAPPPPPPPPPPPEKPPPRPGIPRADAGARRRSECQQLVDLILAEWPVHPSLLAMMRCAVRTLRRAVPGRAGTRRGSPTQTPAPDLCRARSLALAAPMIRAGLPSGSWSTDCLTARTTDRRGRSGNSLANAATIPIASTYIRSFSLPKPRPTVWIQDNRSSTASENRCRRNRPADSARFTQSSRRTSHHARCLCDGTGFRNPPIEPSRNSGEPRSSPPSGCCCAASPVGSSLWSRCCGRVAARASRDRPRPPGQLAAHPPYLPSNAGSAMCAAVPDPGPCLGSRGW